MRPKFAILVILAFTSLTSAPLIAQSTAAANVTAGAFGANYGGGNFTFPARVGVGTASPTHLLSVGPATIPAVQSSFTAVIGDATEGRLGVAAGTGQAAVIRGRSDYAAVNAYNYNAFSPMPLILQDPSFDGGAPSRVGIGTTTPAAKLDVAGDAKISVRAGIGTAPNPSYALDVAGDVNISGNVNAKYQDVAEWVPTTGPVVPGTVVVVSDHGVDGVSASRVAYDTRVAGVVSAQPGITLGTAAAGKAAIATTGRVRVRVDASRGAIAKGDLLVTSDRPGMAMRSEPVDVAGVKMHRPGTLIGKALEPLASGEGEILVLLSLQ